VHLLVFLRKFCFNLIQIHTDWLTFPFLPLTIWDVFLYMFNVLRKGASIVDRTFVITTSSICHKSRNNKNLQWVKWITIFPLQKQEEFAENFRATNGSEKTPKKKILLSEGCKFSATSSSFTKYREYTAWWNIIFPKLTWKTAIYEGLCYKSSSKNLQLINLHRLGCTFTNLTIVGKVNLEIMKKKMF
jgi:hypothetical protein